MAANAPILIVDDYSDIRMLIRIYLEELGHTVEEASGGATAVAKAAQRDYTAIVLDLGLPAYQGFDALKALRAVTSVPIVVYSGRDSSTDRLQGRQLGADDYVGKGAGAEALAARVVAAVTRQQALTGPQQERVPAIGG